MFVLSVYMLVYGERIGRLVRRAMPDGDGTPADDYPILVQHAVSRYVGGQLLFSVLMGASAGLSLYVFGLIGIFPDGRKYALAFGMFYGVMELVPYIGPILGALPAVLVALFTDPIVALWVALLFVGLQQLEGHVVAPQVFGHTLRINPLLVIFALLLGLQLHGSRRRPDRAADPRDPARDGRLSRAATSSSNRGIARRAGSCEPRPASSASRGLAMRYGEREALRDVSFEAAAGELVAVVGPNGAGKTTLLSILAGIQRPSAGSVNRAPRAKSAGCPSSPRSTRSSRSPRTSRLFARLERVADPDAAVERMLEQTGLRERAREQRRSASRAATASA